MKHFEELIIRKENAIRKNIPAKLRIEVSTILSQNMKKSEVLKQLEERLIPIVRLSGYESIKEETFRCLHYQKVELNGTIYVGCTCRIYIE